MKITIESDLKDDTALVVTAQERQSQDGRALVTLNACDIDDVVNIIEKRLKVASERGTPTN